MKVNGNKWQTSKDFSILNHRIMKGFCACADDACFLCIFWPTLANLERAAILSHFLPNGAK